MKTPHLSGSLTTMHSDVIVHPNGSLKKKERTPLLTKEMLVSTNHIDALKAEVENFQKTIIEALDSSTARRNSIWSSLLGTQSFNSGSEISEKAFFTELESLSAYADNVGAILQEAGFQQDVVSAWLGGSSAPSASFRRPLIQLLFSALRDSIDPGPEADLYRILQVRGFAGPDADARRRTRLPLGERISALAFSKELSVRMFNCIKNEGIVTLGELLVPSHAEWLRVPNFGRKSANELNMALRKQFGIGIGEIPERERARFEGMSVNRSVLEAAAGQPLSTRWNSGELKSEFRDLSTQDRREKMSAGTEIYVQIFADTALIESLRQAGIVQKTQLATAPQHVIEQICQGRGEWTTQLPNLLKLDLYRLNLYTKVPLHLDPRVLVYEPRASG